MAQQSPSQVTNKNHENTGTREPSGQPRTETPTWRTGRPKALCSTAQHTGMCRHRAQQRGPQCHPPEQEPCSHPRQTPLCLVWVQPLDSRCQAGSTVWVPVPRMAPAGTQPTCPRPLSSSETRRPVFTGCFSLGLTPALGKDTAHCLVTAESQGGCPAPGRSLD